MDRSPPIRWRTRSSRDAYNDTPPVESLPRRTRAVASSWGTGVIGVATRIGAPRGAGSIQLIDWWNFNFRSGSLGWLEVIHSFKNVLSRISAVGLGVLALACHSGQPADGADQPLPVRVTSNLFYATPVTTGGDTVRFYLDTGGGTNMFYEPAVERLGLTTEYVRDGKDSNRLAAMPSFLPSHTIPVPIDSISTGRRLLIYPPRDFDLDGDGFLGRTWFADRSWLLDYPGQALTLLSPAGATAFPADEPHVVTLGFQVDSAGRRTTHFPRIRVEVDGDSLDLLLDTGAMVVLKDSAQAELGSPGPRVQGTSFIAENVFTRWRKRHSDWRIIENADHTLNMPMIQVQEMSIGGHTVGPVWFTMRPDKSFHEFMSQWMDRRVEGALGGSGLRYFRILLDYPHGVAVFTRP